MASQGAIDRRYMRRAIQLALRARGRTSPNPLVGCLIVDGARVLATGFHAQAGLDHGEAAALRKLDWRAPGATVYVTLEPHDHQGRTERLIAAGVARVVVGMRDPDPRAAGSGVARLREAGVVVEEEVLAEQCRAINLPYLKHVATRRPFVTVAPPVPQLRDENDAVLVGAGLVQRDDPTLSARMRGKRARDPLRVILDGRLSIPSRARALPALILTAMDAPAERAEELARRGAEIVRLPGGPGRVDLGAALDELGRRDVCSLLVEGGGDVVAQLVAAGLVDRDLGAMHAFVAASQTDDGWR